MRFIRACALGVARACWTAARAWHPGSYRLTVGARGSAGVAQAGQHPAFTLLA